MPPKRKRGGTRKPVSRKLSVVGKKEETNKKSAPVLSTPVGQSEEAFLNFVNQNNKGNSRCEDSNDYEDGQPDQGRDNDVQFEVGKPDQGRDNGIHFKTGGNSSSSSESDESISSEDSSYRDRAVDKRKRKSVEAHEKAIEKARKLLEKVEKDKYNSSQVLRTSSRNPKEFRVPHQALQRNKKELEAALAVIKKVMEMDEAQPFNVPVNPVALGKADYFDVINSPMDFGTICNNLQNNVKYMNSEDAFEDVKLIWENCCKYNKKGEYVVYLVKRVKKKFMKYWAAAGLGIKQSTRPDENSHLPAPVDYTMRHNRYEPTQALGNAMNGTSQVHQNMLLDQPHVQVPTLSYSQPYQAQQHLPIAMVLPISQFPSPSMNQPQYSHFQDRAESSSAGPSRFQPPNDSVQKHKNFPARSSRLAPMVSPPTRQSQPPQPQPQMSNRQPHASQHPLQPSTSNLQPSRSKAAENTGASLSPLIFQAGLLARPGFNPALQYPSGPPMTLHTQFQLPADRSTGSSRQDGQAHPSPPSVQQSGGSSSTPLGTDNGERKTRGMGLPKTVETGDIQARVKIRLEGKYFEVLSEHPKVKTHQNVISDIGALVGNNYPGAWYKLPADKQKVVEDYEKDEGYVWPRQVKLWLDSLKRRYAWPPAQHDDVVARFKEATGKRMRQMIYDGRSRCPECSGENPCWATPEQWAKILQRVALDKEYLATCDLNKKNRNANGKFSTHGTGRKPHKEIIAEAVKKKGKGLTFTEQFMLTHAKKGAKFDGSTPAPEAEVVETFKTRYGRYWEVGVELFGSVQENWPDDWQGQVLAHMENPVYKGNIPGFAYLTPDNVSRPRRRNRNAGISIGSSPASNLATQEDVEQLRQTNATLVGLVAQLYAKGGDATSLAAAQADLKKLNDELQAERQARKELERL